jgi:hypothetical protein
MGRDHFPNLPIGAGMGFSRGIMLLDDFEGTFTWVVGGTGGDDVHALAPAAAWQGTYGLHLKSRTTNSAENDYTIVQKIFDYPASGLLVARVRTAPIVVANTKRIEIGLRIDDGAQQYAATLRVAVSTGKVYYLLTAATWVEIPILATTFVGGTWYTVELAIDCLAQKWISARFNGFTADLSAIPLYNDAASSGRSALLTLDVDASAAGPGEAYFDNAYVGEYLES